MTPSRLNVLRRHLTDRARAIGAPEDLCRIVEGDISAIPRDLRWANSAEIAHLINGYELSPALGLGQCGDFANERGDQANRGGWSGNVVELWLCLFFEHRRWRHFGLEPTGTELAKLNALCAALAHEAQQLATLRNR